MPLTAVILTYKIGEDPEYKKNSERRTPDKLDFGKCGT